MGLIQAYLAKLHVCFLKRSQISVVYGPDKYKKSFLKAFKCVLRRSGERELGYMSEIFPGLEVAFWKDARLYSLNYP